MKLEIEKRLHSSAVELLLSSLSVLDIPAPSNPAIFALRDRRIGQGASPLSMHGDIPYSFDSFPFCREPQEEIVNPEVQLSVWEFASGMAKSEMAVNAIGYCIKDAPCNIFVAYPKDDSRDKFSRDVVQRSLIDATPAIRDLVYAQKSRDGGNTIAYKRFAGGSLYMVGANSASNFRGPRCGMAYGGEIDGMEDTPEGDPIFLLLKRCEGFEKAIKILEGTPTIKGKSRVESWMADSDRRCWFVPCRKCNKRFVLMWRNVRWPEHGRNRHEKAVVLCEHCAVSHNDEQRRRMILAGRWQGTQDFNGIRGYWLNGLNSLLPAEKGFKTKLHQFASDASRSGKTKESKRVWINTFLAEPWEDEQDKKQDWRLLFERREDYPGEGLPLKIIILEAGVDVQTDRIEAEILGIGRDDETWGVEKAVFIGDPRTPEIWTRLEAWLNRAFVREDKARLLVRGLGCDTGSPTSQMMAYTWIRPRQARNYHAMKGASQIDAPVIHWSKKSKVDRVRLLIVGTHRIKDVIYDRALLETPGVGYMHFPKDEKRGYNEEFFRGLLSENPYPEFKAGVRLRRFKHEKKEDGVLERNEPLDCRVYALAAFYARGPVNWDAEERRNLLTIPQTGTAATPTAATRRRSTGGDFFKW